MAKRVLVVGGSGFVGRHVCNALAKKGIDGVVLSRITMDDSSADIDTWIHPSFGAFVWDNTSTKWINQDAFVNIDSVVYLAGASIVEKRLTQPRKLLCEESRIAGTRFLVDSLQQAGTKLSSFIGVSSILYYGSTVSNQVKDENSPAGSDWAAKLSVNWEMETLSSLSIARNTTILRFPTILGYDGGTYPKLALMARHGLIVALGNGTQQFPWIHIDDVSSTIVAALCNPDHYAGIFNCVAPDQVSNAEFASALACSFQKPHILPNVPSFAVKAIMGTELGNILLGGSPVSGEKLARARAGFVLKYPVLRDALADLAQETLAELAEQRKENQ
jgi:uncharacterized protein (TIGR01777 family)